MKLPALPLALTLLATFAVFAPSLGNGYAMDDRLIAIAHQRGRPNPMISRLQPVTEYFRSHYWKGNVEEDALYRPVTVLSYALVQHWTGPAEIDPADNAQLDVAFWQHLANVLLHLAAVLLVYGLLRRLRVQTGAATAGALVFGLHAMHSEVVAAIVGRAELFAFVFGAAAIQVSFADRNRILRAVLALGLFFLAFASKENAIAWIGFAIVFGLAHAWRREPDTAPTRPGVEIAWALAPAVVAAACFLVLRHAVVGDFAHETAAFTVNPLAHVDGATRVETATFIWAWKGLGLTLLPVRLAADYGAMVFPLISSALDPRFWLSAVILLGVLAFGLLRARRHPLLFLAATSFLGFSFVVSNVPFAIGTIFGERLYYTPSLAVAFLAAWAVTRSSHRPAARTAVTVVGAAWLAVSASVILDRNGVWYDDPTLFLGEVRRQPDSTRMQLCAATVQSNRGNRSIALEHLRNAIRLDPDYAIAWNNLAAIYFELGRFDEAEFAARQALVAEHKDPAGTEDLFKIHCNLGLILARTGRVDDAIRHFVHSLEYKPDFEQAWTEAFQAGVANQRLPMLRTLLESPQRSIGSAWWPYYLGVIAAREGQTKDAQASFARALEVDPALAPARFRLIVDAQARGDHATVERHIAAGKQHTPDRPEWDVFRGRLLAQRGETVAALDAYLDALAIRPTEEPADAAFVELARSSGKVREAAGAVAKREAARPGLAVWPFLRGLLLDGTGDPKIGIAALGRALEDDPRHVRAWREAITLADQSRETQTFYDTMCGGHAADGAETAQWSYFRGVAERMLGKLDDARSSFAQALARDAAFIDARLELLALEWETESPRRVLDLIGRGAVHDPENAHWPLYRGLLANKAGDHVVAIACLERGLTTLTQHAPGRLALATSLAAVGRADDASAVLTALANDQSAPPAARAQAAARLESRR